MANLYTKTGDKGETSLYGGKRVKKSSAKVDCYGTIDEANSMLGLAYSQLKDENIKLYINSIQKRLFSVGAELASDENGLNMLQGKISEKDVYFLENIVDECTEIVGKQTSFVIPGKNTASASLHVARTIIRRAERKIIALNNEDPVRDILLKYVNRLSDAIYALARVEEYNSEVEVIKNKVVKKLKAKFSKDFNLANIKKMAEFAEKKAMDMNVPMVFSAVDEGGNIILVHRMENSLLASLDISQNKAYTALSLKMPTSDLTDLAKESGSLYGIQSSNDNRIVIFGGGFPIEVNGKIVGAIGVSGGTVEEDIEIAQYAINSLMNSL